MNEYFSFLALFSERDERTSNFILPEFTLKRAKIINITNHIGVS